LINRREKVSSTWQTGSFQKKKRDRPETRSVLQQGGAIALRPEEAVALGKHHQHGL